MWFSLLDTFIVHGAARTIKLITASEQHQFLKEENGRWNLSCYTITNDMRIAFYGLQHVAVQSSPLSSHQAFAILISLSPSPFASDSV
jgi:hypothetical protein